MRVYSKKYVSRIRVKRCSAAAISAQGKSLSMFNSTRRMPTCIFTTADFPILWFKDVVLCHMCTERLRRITQA